MKHFLLALILGMTSLSFAQDGPGDDNARYAKSQEMKNYELNVFPNPATSTVFVVGQEPLHGVKIYDLTGQIVEASLGSSEIHLEHLHPALYLLEVQFEDGEKRIEHLIVE